MSMRIDTKSISWFLFIILWNVGSLFAQCVIEGKITDLNGQGIENVSISYQDGSETKGVITNSKGSFSIRLTQSSKTKLTLSHVSYLPKNGVTSCGQKNFSLSMEKNEYTFPEISITDKKQKAPAQNMEKIESKNFKSMPTASGSFESILYGQAGVSSRNELSSQYSVRGGNFDENLIYVNDIEIYRPFLVRSGQQEGLSFINPSMVDQVYFSAGGFEAKYGDKMSSVLDITYKEPTAFKVLGEVSFLGASLNVEDASSNYRFQQLHGIRFRSNQYLLGALETQGDYKPVFADYQTLLSYQINDDWGISFLGHMALNNYVFEPKDRQTDFGTVQQAIRLNVYFEGQEKNKFDTYTGAFTLKYKPSYRNTYQWINSAFISNEREFFDVLGQYRLSELEVDLSKEDFGNEKFTLGVGSFLHHARNELLAKVYASQISGKHLLKKQAQFQWGLKYQMEHIVDNFREWKLIDSADYSIPHFPDSIGYTHASAQAEKYIEMSEFTRFENTLLSHRMQGYFQYQRKWGKDSVIYAYTLGNRAAFWTYNQQFISSPRFTLRIDPTHWKKNIDFRAALGIYQQSPFYREQRGFDGQLNPQIKAQSSAQILAGADYYFKAWDRPFKWTAEVYYKYLWNLIPYDVDNVRIRYYAQNSSKGYTYGLDTKLSGELVRGIDSWFSLSVLSAKEDIENDAFYIYYNDNGEKITPAILDQVVTDSTLFEPGFIRRLTDQRVNVGLFFQDYFPGHPEYKVHLNLLYGSSIPYGPLLFRTRDTLTMPAYRRVDIGFSAMLRDPLKENPKFFKSFHSVWLTLEVFNLLQIDNVISYLWVKDAYQRDWPVPNNLTSRRINLRLTFEF